MTDPKEKRGTKEILKMTPYIPEVNKPMVKLDNGNIFNPNSGEIINMLEPKEKVSIISKKQMKNLEEISLNELISRLIERRSTVQQFCIKHKLNQGNTSIKLNQRKTHGNIRNLMELLKMANEELIVESSIGKFKII